MLKNIIKLEAVVAGKVFNFLCDNDSPLEHVKESLFQFLKLVGQIEDQVKAQKDAEAAAAAPVPDIQPVVEQTTEQPQA